MNDPDRTKISYMSESQMPPVDLNKCAECKKPFSKGQEYWELFRKDIKEVSMNSCLPCWDKYETKKKT